MEEPVPEKNLPLPSPQPSRELLEGSWGLDLTPERDIKPRKRLREPNRPNTKTSRESKDQEGTVYSFGREVMPGVIFLEIKDRL